jgi:hypothetical protein
LRSTLSVLGVCPACAEPPEDHERCESLNQAVCPEPDERDRGGRDTRADRDRELNKVPSVAAPGKKSCPADQACPLCGRRHAQPPKWLHLKLGHGDKRRADAVDRVTVNEGKATPSTLTSPDEASDAPGERLAGREVHAAPAN